MERLLPEKEQSQIIGADRRSIERVPGLLVDIVSRPVEVVLTILFDPVPDRIVTDTPARSAVSFLIKKYEGLGIDFWYQHHAALFESHLPAPHFSRRGE